MKVESGSSFKASTSVEASNPEKERGGGGGSRFSWKGEGASRQHSNPGGHPVFLLLIFGRIDLKVG